MSNSRPTPIHTTIAEARETPIPDGLRSAILMRHGSMRVHYYAPAGQDEQTPHSQDEVYVVVAGNGRFEVGEESRAFGPNDVLFAPANVVHRFVDFSDEFAAWVVFYGPEGGEEAAGA